MLFSKKSHEGYVMLDHRASPGIPAHKARRLGYHPDQVKEGQLFEAPVLGCPHCGAAVVMNPLRTRERANCLKCNRYICDWCAAASQEEGYVHITAAQIAEMVNSGRYVLTGSMHRPKLTPIGEFKNG